MKKHTFFIIFIIMTALAIGMWREQRAPSQAIQQFTAHPLTSGTALPQTHKLTPFQLVDMHGKAFTEQSLKQKWSFVFFGYSTCPNICPLALSTMQQISQRVKGIYSVQFVFISIDPNRDTPENLLAYFNQPKYKDTAFIGVTGEKERILALVKAIGAHVGEENKEATEHIEHSGALFLINPEGQLAAIFTNQAHPAAIVSDLKEIMHRYASAS